MNFKRIPWRIGLPYTAFVLLGSVALVIWMGWNLSNEGRARFEMLARTNADFINRVQLPASERMAAQLGQVIGIDVFFRKDGQLTPEPFPLVSSFGLPEVPADGKSHRIGTLEVVGVPLKSGHDLMLAREAFASWREVLHPSTFAVLGAFWLLALFVAWLVARGLVQPLRHLAAKLPEIEKPGALELVEVTRDDEIGDVARAFMRTREALQDEREQREKAEKLAVLGRMTAALAHEIQNPVAAIKMHAQLMGADIIESEAGRIEALVSQWMFLSKPEPPAMSELDVGLLLQSTLTSHRAQMDHALVRAETDIADGLMIRGDRRRLIQVLSNLIINAIQAMPCGGVLNVTAKSISSQREIEISWVDSGAGFSEKALLHFAEYFYSEKEGGMGIGLSIASEIVKAHGGELCATNGDKGGARVTVKLPLAHGTSLAG